MSGITIGLVNLTQVIFHDHNIRADLGDLRSLTASIQRYGVMQPVVVEKYGTKFRLRAGHRRTAATRLAGLTRIPAVIHPEPLSVEEWITQSVHENTQRDELTKADRKRAVDALRTLNCTWAGIADAFGISETTARAWAANPDIERPKPAKTGPGPRARATARLIERHQAEYERLLAEERRAVDWVIVRRGLDGQKVQASKAEKIAITNAWRDAGRSLNELSRIQGWHPWRYTETAPLVEPPAPAKMSVTVIMRHPGAISD